MAVIDNIVHVLSPGNGKINAWTDLEDYHVAYGMTMCRVVKYSGGVNWDEVQDCDELRRRTAVACRKRWSQIKHKVPKGCPWLLRSSFFPLPDGASPPAVMPFPYQELDEVDDTAIVTHTDDDDDVLNTNMTAYSGSTMENADKETQEQEDKELDVADAGVPISAIPQTKEKK